MASNLSSIGFVFRDAEDFHARMLVLAEETRERLSCEDGEYAIWRSRTGAEVWFHLAPSEDADEQATILGLAPFFEGQSSVSVLVTQVHKRPDDSPLEGLLHGWVAPDGNGAGAYPLAFDAIDFAAHATRPLPATWTCRVTGFCRNLNVHADASTLPEVGEGQRLAPQALIPIGLFNDADEDEAPTATGVPEPTAWLTGIVRAHRLLENEATGRSFHWLSVESIAATYDLVADPDIVTGEIVEGRIVEVMAWMFARVLD
ncbi:MAG TPA: hypothetical protein P5114_05900 [Hyphomicrobiaceae bacterium]|nr:hypothetical protein [Hyphomicrobiaceae bacterium]